MIRDFNPKFLYVTLIHYCNAQEKKGNQNLNKTY